ncbi:hypothetical protein [Actinophytocola sp.]
MTTDRCRVGRPPLEPPAPEPPGLPPGFGAHEQAALDDPAE